MNSWNSTEIRMFNTIAWELKQRRAVILWWTLGSILLCIAIMALYPSIRDKANDLNQVINQLPQGLRGLKTGGAASVNVADPIQFLNSQLFYATLPIIWIILAITRGSAILGGDEQNHTLELWLSRPIGRGNLLVAKGVSLILEFVIIGTATLLTIVLLAPAFQLHIGTSHLILAVIYTVLFSLSFGLIAFALTAFGRFTKRAATAIAVIVSFGGYLIASLSGLTDWLKIPAKLAPFHYFAPDKIMHGQIAVGLNIYLVGVFILGVLVSYLGFRRRDIS
jgi:ABC-2 type transport system permease protein